MLAKGIRERNAARAEDAVRGTDSATLEIALRCAASAAEYLAVTAEAVALAPLGAVLADVLLPTVLYLQQTPASGIIAAAARTGCY